MSYTRGETDGGAGALLEQLCAECREANCSSSKKTISHLQAKGCQFTPWLVLQVLLGFLILRDRQEKIRNTLLGKKKRSSDDIMCHIMS